MTPELEYISITNSGGLITPPAAQQEMDLMLEESTGVKGLSAGCRLYNTCG